MSSKKHSDPLYYPLSQYPVILIDYIWVITIYVTLSFSLAVIIDGYILPPFDLKVESTYSSVYLGLKITTQLAVQGFIAIMLHSLVERIQSPVEGIFGYNPKSTLGEIIRNPAIISVILLTLSSSLRARLMYLFSRITKTDQVTNFEDSVIFVAQ